MTALTRVESWYAARGLRPLVQLFGEEGFDPRESPVARAGWPTFQRTLVMTAATESVAGSPSSDSSQVEVLAVPTAEYWSAVGEREQEHRSTSAAILDRVRSQAFLVARADRRVVGAARIAFSPGWWGVFNLHVEPSTRRAGVARTLMRTAAREAAAHGAQSAYLQVSADNDAAVGLYRSLGYETHHEYWYAAPA